ncbi:MAG: DDE-type integrase/transposase/recombinase [Gammaproteobacteria bacterium]|nr:DDE-type integrase/transposase/recombinase [Gammaproteobacteria bacterium]
MMTSEKEILLERGVVSVSKDAWELARLRTEIIAPLARLKEVSHALADEAARKLDLSRRHVYLLISRFRQGQGLVTDMLLSQSCGGKNNSRLPSVLENIIQEVLRTHYLNKQKFSEAAIWREIAGRCRRLQLPVPARNTIHSRIKRLDVNEVVRKREGVDATRSLQSAGGVPPEITLPLEQVQMDHTVIDLMVVDDIHRLPIGRPYLTVAIDVFSRCILGMLVTLEAPSAVSVGLCLARAVGDKRPWLERLGVDIDWPMGGKPQSLYVDNATEFKSEALRRGCQQHGIALHYRPPGKMHYGGIVERVIGTFMQKVHELPGTTFSNPTQKGDYDSEAKATLSLNELEHWLALAIHHYHGTLHHGLIQTPAARWAEGMASLGKVFLIAHPQNFLIDFLPVLRRKIVRTGFVIDHITYYADILKSWITNRSKLDKFIIRRNPLDLSRIWVLCPDSQHYIEIPYRILSRPGLTLWEHRQAIQQLRAKGRAQIDETLLFRMVSEMREITQAAQSTTRKARRNQQRLSHLSQRPVTQEKQTVHVPKLAPLVNTTAETAKPFDQIEEW